MNSVPALKLSPIWRGSFNLNCAVFLERIKSAFCPSADKPPDTVNIPFVTNPEVTLISTEALAVVPRLEVKIILFPLSEAVTPVTLELITLTHDCNVLFLFTVECVPSAKKSESIKVYVISEVASTDTVNVSPAAIVFDQLICSSDTTCAIRPFLFKGFLFL